MTYLASDWAKEYEVLEARIAKLEKALDDIVKGRVPAGEMPSLDDKLAFRDAMWSWSQKRAQEGLDA